MKTLYIVRHGETQWNVDKRFQGQLDSPLTTLGREQIAAHGERLKSFGGVDQLYVSPAGRTQESANLLNSFVQAQMTTVDALIEASCGEWEGMSYAEIQAEYPEEWSKRQQDSFSHRPPGGENIPDLVERVRPFLEDLYADSARSIALVTHGLMSRAVLHFLLELGSVETSRVRHPNDLFYEIAFSATDVEVFRHRIGNNAEAGLLHHTDDGTIVKV